MKIVFFLPHADDGIIRSTIPIIEGFNDKGYVTEVVTLRAKGRMTDQLDIVSKAVSYTHLTLPTNREV